MQILNYCTCGAPQDEEGICTNKKCIRRKFQLNVKAKQEAKKKADEKAEKEREEQGSN